MSCRRNIHDPYYPYAVSVHKSFVVGHVPRTISAVCSLFVRQGRSISCQVTGNRRYLVDLPQGGLELPCHPTFEHAGYSKILNKLKRLMSEAPKLPLGSVDEEPPKKKAKLGGTINTQQVNTILSNHGQPPKTLDIVWGQFQSHTLLMSEKASIQNGQRLTDRHMNFCQAVLKSQNPTIEGFECTLFQAKEREKKMLSGIQVVHLRSRDHWILCSINDQSLSIYDSVFSSMDDELLEIINLLFDFTTYTFIKFQKQTGFNDCGLFALAAACALVFDQDPSLCQFNQEAMRNHLIICIENGFFSCFPSIATKKQSNCVYL